MSALPKPAPVLDPAPRTMKYCGTCREYTPHEITRQTTIVILCIRCLERALAYELDRD
jgi:hypothetical protein